MFSNPVRYEIDHRTLKFIVGVIAFSLGCVTSFFSENEIRSISASYHEGGWARDYFVGSLFAIFAFMLAYNGQSRLEMILSKIAAFASLGVAVFPCKCENHEEIIPGAHAISAGVMFVILAMFCFLFHMRARVKSGVEAKRRSVAYILCGITIVLSILVLVLNFLFDDAISNKVDRLTFYCETAGLIAFGIAWLTASQVLPMLTNAQERINPFS